MTSAEPNARAQAWLDRLECALAAADAGRAAVLFAQPGYWRDILAFTWNLKTMEGKLAIGAMLDANLTRVGAHGFKLSGDARDLDGEIEAFFTFATRQGRGLGVLRLAEDGAAVLLTALDALAGHEERAGPDRDSGVRHGAVRNRTTWLEDRESESAALGISEQPYALIVGGGQAGIALGARLRRLGVPTLIVEKNVRPGDSWRNRYRTLTLHDPVWYDHLPYLPFPDDWPVFAPKDKMGDWLESYAKIMELNLWGRAECRQARFDGASGEWEVEIDRDGERVVVRPRQLVLCTGAYGPPRMPEIAGADAFGGEIMHSVSYRDGAAWKGRNCVVIGSNTSAHDICADLWESGAGSVTMIQRSPSTVVTSETLLDIAFGPLYSERAVASGITTDRADLIFASIPFALMADVHTGLTETMRERDGGLLKRLRSAGFLLDFGCDGSGLVMKAFRTGSGYYIDVGCSELIASGEVAVRSGVEPVRFTPGQLALSDGSRIEADLAVFCTGYHSMRQTIGRLLSDGVAERIGHCWGYGSATPGDPGPWEGEMRNLWKPTAQDALWLHGGNLHLSRFYSKFVALQIKARMEGMPTPVYGPPSTPLSKAEQSERRGPVQGCDNRLGLGLLSALDGARGEA